MYTYRFPREWIKGDGYPEGIGRNEELSERDKEHVKRLYGPSRLSSVPGGTGGSGRGGTVTPVVPIAPPERHKPVTSLPRPSGNTIHDVQVYEPHRGNKFMMKPSAYHVQSVVEWGRGQDSAHTDQIEIVRSSHHSGCLTTTHYYYYPARMQKGSGNRSVCLSVVSRQQKTRLFGRSRHLT